MLANKSYLINAFYQWIVDSDCTPIIIVDAAAIEHSVSEQSVEDGEVFFNIAPDAVRDLEICYESLSFRATFSGLVQTVVIPIAAVLAIYAEENNEGMYFNYEDEPESQDEQASTITPRDSKSKTKGKTKKTAPLLRIVK